MIVRVLWRCVRFRVTASRANSPVDVARERSRRTAISTHRTHGTRSGWRREMVLRRWTMWRSRAVAELDPEFVERILAASGPGDYRDALILADYFLERGETQ